MVQAGLVGVLVNLRVCLGPRIRYARLAAAGAAATGVALGSPMLAYNLDIIIPAFAAMRAAAVGPSD